MTILKTEDTREFRDLIHSKLEKLVEYEKPLVSKYYMCYERVRYRQRGDGTNKDLCRNTEMHYHVLLWLETALARDRVRGLFVLGKHITVNITALRKPHAKWIPYLNGVEESNPVTWRRTPVSSDGLIFSNDL